MHNKGIKLKKPNLHFSKNSLLKEIIPKRERSANEIKDISAVSTQVTGYHSFLLMG